MYASTCALFSLASIIKVIGLNVVCLIEKDPVRTMFKICPVTLLCCGGPKGPKYLLDVQTT